MAHRLFGTQHRVVEPRIEPSRGRNILSHLGVEPLAPVRTVRAFPDYSRGTTRSETDVRALFAREAGYEYPGGLTLNEIFEPLGVRFQLLRMVDEMIASHTADLAGDVALEGIARRLNQPGVLNVYFLRDILGAHGIARTYSRHQQYPPYAVVADRLDASSAAFPRSVIVLAHELGHVLGLPHMPGDENLMYDRGTSLANLMFDPPQTHVARHRASMMAATSLAVDVDLHWSPPQVDLYRDWFLPLDAGEE